MLKPALAALASLVLVSVLAFLIVESGAIKEEYYGAHAERMRGIESSKIDLAAITQGTQSAFQEGRAIPASIELAVARVAENGQYLQSWTNNSGRRDSTATSQINAYDEALNLFISDQNSFSARQNAVAEGLLLLQEESPTVIKDLRRLNLPLQSQNVFSLAIEIMEFATGQSSAGLKQVADRLEALRSDAVLQGRAPGRLDAFVTAASSVIIEHTAAETALEKINGSQVAAQLEALAATVVLENRQTVHRAERARLLLAICAVLLLGGTGYAILRLRLSYRALNKSNADLEEVNNSLEDRVQSRTEELSLALEKLKDSQVQLVQAEKMSSLGQMIAGISHEINTPLYYLTTNATVIQERLNAAREFCAIGETMLAAVRSRSSVKEAIAKGLHEMQKRFGDGMIDDIDEAKDLMQDSVSGLEDLIEFAQSLRDFSRLDRAREGQFDINDGLDKALLIAKHKLKYNIDVHKHYGEVPLIYCSPSQINQIFLNLITNSADAIDGNGDIVIRTWNEDAKVCVSISDTGCGIPADTLEKIRDPFFTTKEVGKGTGLGLSIVEQIVTTHNGELHFESEPGEGTTVTVTFPFRARDRSEDSADGEESPAQQPAPVLAELGNEVATL